MGFIVNSRVLGADGRPHNVEEGSGDERVLHYEWIQVRTGIGQYGTHYGPVRFVLTQIQQTFIERWRLLLQLSLVLQQRGERPFRSLLGLAGR